MFLENVYDLKEYYQMAINIVFLIVLMSNDVNYE